MSTAEQNRQVVYKVAIYAYWRDKKGALKPITEDSTAVTIRTPMVDSNLGMWVINTMNKQAKQAREGDADEPN